ncbi:hypothetical protein SLEX105133_04505 [Slackia exigua]
MGLPVDLERAVGADIGISLYTRAACRCRPVPMERLVYLHHAGGNHVLPTIEHVVVCGVRREDPVRLYPRKFDVVSIAASWLDRDRSRIERGVRPISNIFPRIWQSVLIVAIAHFHIEHFTVLRALSFLRVKAAIPQHCVRQRDVAAAVEIILVCLQVELAVYLVFDEQPPVALFRIFHHGNVHPVGLDRAMVWGAFGIHGDGPCRVIGGTYLPCEIFNPDVVIGLAAHGGVRRRDRLLLSGIQPALDLRQIDVCPVGHVLYGHGEFHGSRRGNGICLAARVQRVIARQGLACAVIRHLGIREPGHGAEVEGRLLFRQG